MSKNTLTITDNRTGKTYELPITDDTIRTADLRQIKVADDDFGMMGYDPAFLNTASCRSAITLIDGEKLIDLLIEYEVGFRKKPIDIIELDPGAFAASEQDARRPPRSSG